MANKWERHGKIDAAERMLAETGGGASSWAEVMGAGWRCVETGGVGWR